MVQQMDSLKTMNYGNSGKMNISKLLLSEVISKVNEITIIDFFKNEFQLKTHDFINHICSISIFDIFFSKFYIKTSFLGYNKAILP